MATAKEFVLERYPDAFASETHFVVSTKGKWGVTIKSIYPYGYFAFGEKLQSSAWKNAKAKILEG